MRSRHPSGTMFGYQMGKQLGNKYRVLRKEENNIRLGEVIIENNILNLDEKFFVIERYLPSD